MCPQNDFKEGIFLKSKLTNETYMWLENDVTFRWENFQFRMRKI